MENDLVKYAVKELYNSSQTIKRELLLLRTLPSHPNIIKVYDIFEEKLSTSVIMDRGDFDLLKWISTN